MSRPHPMITADFHTVDRVLSTTMMRMPGIGFITQSIDAGRAVMAALVDAGFDIVPRSDPSPADSLTVRIDAHGAAQLRAVDGEAVVGITVPKEKRREFGLELMGGLDALVERLAIWYLEEQFLMHETPDDFYTDHDEDYRNILRAKARGILEKALGE